MYSTPTKDSLPLIWLRKHITECPAATCTSGEQGRQECYNTVREVGTDSHSSSTPSLHSQWLLQCSRVWSTHSRVLSSLPWSLQLTHSYILQSDVSPMFECIEFTWEPCSKIHLDWSSLWNWESNCPCSHSVWNDAPDTDACKAVQFIIIWNSQVLGLLQPPILPYSSMCRTSSLDLDFPPPLHLVSELWMESFQGNKKVGTWMSFRPRCQWETTSRSLPDTQGTGLQSDTHTLDIFYREQSPCL